MHWVTLVLGLLLLVLLLLSLVPLGVEVFLATPGERRLEVRPSWGGLSLGTAGAKAPSARARRKKTSRAPESGARASLSPNKLRALLMSEDFVASVARWLGRLLRLLAPEEWRVCLRFGTGDPCETGRILAAVAPLLALGAGEGANLDLQPDFVGQTFELRAYARFRLVPLVALAVTLGYFFTRAPWRALVNYARA